MTPDERIHIVRRLQAIYPDLTLMSEAEKGLYVLDEDCENLLLIIPFETNFEKMEELLDCLSDSNKKKCKRCGTILKDEETYHQYFYLQGGKEDYTYSCDKCYQKEVEIETSLAYCAYCNKKFELNERKINKPDTNQNYHKECWNDAAPIEIYDLEKEE